MVKEQFAKHLYKAVKEHNINKVHTILAKKNINKYFGYRNKNEYGNSALHVAVANGNIPIINALLNKGFNVNALNSLHVTPLHLAVKMNDIDIVKLLLNKGSDTTILSKIYKNSIFQSAVINSNYTIIKTLLDYGIDIHNVNNSNMTAFDMHLNDKNKKLLYIICMAFGHDCLLNDLAQFNIKDRKLILYNAMMNIKNLNTKFLCINELNKSVMQIYTETLQKKRN